MDKSTSHKIVKETFENSFNKERFSRFAKELLNQFDESKAFHAHGYVKEGFKKTAGIIKTYERLGTFTDPDNKKIDILIVYLEKENSIDRARTTLRNFVAEYLKQRDMKDAALVAFVSPNVEDWRFSLVRMDYKFEEGKAGKIKVKEDFTPARRWSFLVGKNENSHTAQSRLAPIVADDENNPTLKQLEEAFNIEKVTKEFFEKYRDLFLWTKETLDGTIKSDDKVKSDFESKNIDVINFGKKLLGQIVFLYFLQKKGWFGVARDDDWGTGPKNFLRELFEGKHAKYKNFFNDILEPLFYEALRIDRSHDDDYYSKLNCRIPFLNGGLFDPIGDYDWVHTDILLPNELFSNTQKTKEGDIGNGILDIFDRYNFTVKEDEPLEKEVAVDPEMLGKVFENLLEVKDRKSKGTYYTPREIVHFMCQESLANYLATEFEEKVSREDMEILIKYGELAIEHDSRVINKGHETKTYAFKIPGSVRKHAKAIDQKLASVRVCDPAVGSGAFPVGMMSEIIRTRNALTPFLKSKTNRTIYDFKRHAIQNCLYGVDIDPGAVEICKLRLWLSLVVDEEDIKQIKPLPNLDYKILRGNSLLSVEKNSLFVSLWMKELEQIKSQYFGETSPVKKQKFKEKIDELIKQITNGHKEFDFEIYFSEVFGEKDGFDVVIANPPYVDYRKIDSATKAGLLRYESSRKTRMGNLYIYFIELGVKISNQLGTVCYINPHQYLTSDSTLSLREFLIKNTSILKIVDLSDLKIFESASVYTSINIFGHHIIKNNKIQIIKPNTINELNNVAFELAQDEIKRNPNFLIILNTDIKLLEKIEFNSKKLESFCGVFVGSSSSDLGRRNQAKPGHQKDEFCLFLQSSNIHRYFINRNGQYISKNEYPQKIREKFAEKKIFLARMTKDIRASYSDIEECAGKVNVLVNFRENPKYILGLLNSKLINFWYKSKFESRHLAGGYLGFDTPSVKSIPIKISASQKPFVDLVDKILAITKDSDYLQNSAKQAKVHDYEKQIDQLVYKLYGLTEKEIKIVEGS